MSLITAGGTTTGPAGPASHGASGPTADGSARDGPARDRRCRRLWLVAVVAVVALTALLAAVTVPRGGGRLDPDSAEPDGARALVRILARQGVSVHVADRFAEAADNEFSQAAATVLVTRPQLLSPDQLRRLGRLEELVLVEPDELTLAVLAPGIGAAGQVSSRTATAACPVGAARAAGRVTAGGRLYRVRPEASTSAWMCFPDDTDPTSGSFAVQSRSTTGRRVTVLGQSDLLTNERLAEHGNAALALWTLGRREQLIWYTPDPLELDSSAVRPTLGELIPRWVPWVTAQLAVAAGLAIVWRARRMGRLVSEPLPVVVRAAETQEGRARLYRTASARDRAAATLRTTSMRRLATRLSAPPGTSPEALSALVAAAAGRSVADVQQVLLGPIPASDAALVTLAGDLDQLDQQLSPAVRTGRNQPS